MKTIVLFLSTIFVASSALGETFSEKRANGMVTVLQSEQIKELLQVEDGVGNITGIEYHQSVTTDVAQRFKVKFISYGGLNPTVCTVVARVDGSDGIGAVSLAPMECN